MVDVEERPGRELPAHVTLPLLQLITERSLDEDYAHVARQRAAQGATRRSAATSRGVRWLSTLSIAVFGTLVAVAAVQTSRGADEAELGRATLVEQILDARGELDELQAEVGELREQNVAAEDRGTLLDERLVDVQGRMQRLEVLTGYTAVRGPGLRISIDDAPGTDVNTEVRDEDLATLVDGLWEAGAEAIAVNGVRLNVLGGIRNTGRAIHINGRPLTAPYTVLAIGDPATLPGNLLATSQGNAWFTLQRSLGFQFEMETVNDLRLPAAGMRPLRFVDEKTAAGQAGMPSEEGKS